MSMFRNINNVAKYESRILKRSWFFKLFAGLALFMLFVIFLSMFLTPFGIQSWMLKAVPSNIPYFMILFLNMIQAVIAIFLSSEFLKRDKKLDTSEVFYVSPLSNAEYVIGKIYGNIRVFFFLNVLIIGLSVVLSTVSSGVTIDIASYFLYFLLITLPTLIFILGLSAFMMLLLKNQALTFVVLLAYVFVTMFYLQNKCFYLFDYMAYKLPLFKSGMIGFTNLFQILLQRSIYVLLGLAFIDFTIVMFGRLANARHSKYPWLILAFICLILAIGSSVRYLQIEKNPSKIRKIYTSINNNYVGKNYMRINDYQIGVKKQGKNILVTANIQGMVNKNGDNLIFNLNPGLKVDNISLSGDNGKKVEENLKFSRDEQILAVTLPKEYLANQEIMIKITYSGIINDMYSYLDVAEKSVIKESRENFVAIPKKYAFQENNFMLFIPEIAWYPQAGTGFSNTDPQWRKKFFCDYSLDVDLSDATNSCQLVAISQGVATDSLGVYHFHSEEPMTGISLVIGDYIGKSINVDSVKYSYYYTGEDKVLTQCVPFLNDTIGGVIRNTLADIERENNLSFSFKRLSIVEVPAQFSYYTHSWKVGQNCHQPGMILIPEKACSMDMDISQWAKRIKRWGDGSNSGIMTDTLANIKAVERKLKIFRNLTVRQNDANISINFGSNGSKIKMKDNAYFFFPQLYDFKYNLFSDDWSIINKACELYLQNNTATNSWIRRINGISFNEKVNIALKHKRFSEVLGDTTYLDINNQLLKLKLQTLLASAEAKMGQKVVKDTMRFLLDKHRFKDYSFLDMLSSIDKIAGTDTKGDFKKWDEISPMPYYYIPNPYVIRTNGDDGEHFIIQQKISNISDVLGYVRIIYKIQSEDSDDDRLNQTIAIKPHQTLLVQSVWIDSPLYVSIDTGISENLPSIISNHIKDMERRDGDCKEINEIKNISYNNGELENEIVVDNEDSTLFSVSKPELTGLFPRLVNRSVKSEYKYKPSLWGAPIQWLLTTDANFFGKYIRSAYIIHKGNGNSTATWTIPLKGKGRYDLYYYLYKPQWSYSSRKGEYKFDIIYDGECEEAYLNNRNDSGWNLVGSYYFEGDTMQIRLSNKSTIYKIVADAVKLVKK
ncbi:MAG: xanthan lyase [Bacteroidales bacterium]